MNLRIIIIKEKSEWKMKGMRKIKNYASKHFSLTLTKSNLLDRFSIHIQIDGDDDNTTNQKRGK